LGEDDQKLLLARAIQLFMPGIPQIWYLDIFAGTNDYAAADKGGSGGHKEINRTTLTNNAIEEGLKKDVVLHQLKIMRLRNRSSAFSGTVTINDAVENVVDILWAKDGESAHLKANLNSFKFIITHTKEGEVEELSF